MPENLTGKFIKDTYKKVLQVGEDGNMYDGTGSLYIPRSASHEISHEVSSSYAETASFANDFTASGDISASGTIYGATGSFGTNTTTITDKIETTGVIQTDTGIQAPGFTASSKLLQLGASDNRRQELVVYGKIQQKGSDLTIMSGSLTASADISCSTTIKALSGSFGTGTTTITDKIHTTGEIYATQDITSGKGVIAAQAIESQQELRAPGFTASEKRLTLGAADNERQELIVHGKLQIKGSDITFMSGSITASGVITGSDIEASGNITAGDGGTGSFDHIITLDDTIEFRNKANKNEVRGYVKFDPTNGLVPKDHNKADLLRLADRVPYSGLTGTVPTWNQNTTGKANTAGTADKAIILNTARTIDGVSFDGSRNITTNQHMGLLDTQKILIGDFEHKDDLVFTIGAKLASLINTNAKSVITTNAYIQIPVGRTLASITPYGDPTPVGQKAVNKIDMRVMTLEGAYGLPMTFENPRTGKATEALLTRLGTSYSVSKLSAQYSSDDVNFLVITLQLNPETGFSSLILNYS